MSDFWKTSIYDIIFENRSKITGSANVHCVYELLWTHDNPWLLYLMRGATGWVCKVHGSQHYLKSGFATSPAKSTLPKIRFCDFTPQSQHYLKSGFAILPHKVEITWNPVVRFHPKKSVLPQIRFCDFTPQSQNYLKSGFATPPAKSTLPKIRVCDLTQ